MRCRNCGNELNETAKFCPVCGSKTEDVSQAVERTDPSRDTGMAGVSANAQPYGSDVKPPLSSAEQTMITKNVPYYASEFHSIRTLGKSRINWASFFLGLFHAAYRNVWKEWLKFAGIPAVGGLVILIVCSLISAVTGALPVLFAGCGLCLVAELIGVIMQIVFAVKFNRVYMNHVETCIARQQIKPDPSALRSVVAAILYGIAMSICGGVAGTAVAGSMLSMFNSFDGNIVMEDLVADDEDLLSDVIPEITEAVTDEAIIHTETTAHEPAQEDWDFIIADSDSRYLTEDELLRLSPDEIELAGLEIMARRGVYFEEGEVSSFQKKWFESKDWYEPSVDMDTALEYAEYYFNETEMSNLALILTFIDEDIIYPDDMEPFGGENPMFEASNFILPYSDSIYYSEADLRMLSKDELRLARNEIYARHGRIFNAEDLNAYFMSMPWYIPAYSAKEFDSFGDSIFNEFEIHNRDLIKKLEEQ